ncbi:MAG TPA: hypothetical protein VH518_18645 [Tepidisphaeraceae bacterium]|jgi:hypothetical protein
MMAKMFYTLDETKAALGKNEEEIKQYAREGRLREFRDGPRLMFKADQVEALKNELGLGGGTPDMGPSDSGGPIGLVDSRTASATGISLMDTDAAGRSAGGSSQAIQLQEDTAMGLSESVGGVPSPGRTSPSSTGSLAGTRGGSGVNVLGDSFASADPSAQTAISGGGVSDQVSLEGVGSGSGLLDLTRESDDTSLGAELLDEIAPGGTKRGTKAGSGAIGGSGSAAVVAEGTVAGGTVAGTPAPRVGGRLVGTPVFVEAPDSWAPFLGGAALGAAVFVLFGALAVMSAVLDARPNLLQLVANMKMPVLAGIGLGIALVFGALGTVLGKAVR